MKKISKHSREKFLEHSSEDLRWATAEQVADYRALRLKCNRIVDVGCGIGLQSFSFAKQCEKVLAIDIDHDKVEKARRNAATLRIKNIEFLEGDALSEEVLTAVSNFKPDVIFLDPMRPQGEQKREISSISPDLTVFIKLYGAFTQKIAIELPPQIRNVPFDGEREYLSLHGELRRLTLYLGPLIKANKSAVLLQSQSRINSTEAVSCQKGPVSNFLYEVDPAVAKADLVSELCSQMGTWIAIEGKQTFLSSNEAIKNVFFKASFKVLERIPFDLGQISSLLKSFDAGKAVIRYSIDPSAYWNERTKIETGLVGTKVLYIFKSGDEAIICDSFL